MLELHEKMIDFDIANFSDNQFSVDFVPHVMLPSIRKRLMISFRWAISASGLRRPRMVKNKPEFRSQPSPK